MKNSNPLSIRYFSVLIFFLLFGESNQMVQAQFKKSKLIKPILILGYENNPVQSFQDTLGSYGHDEALAGFKIPVISSMMKGRQAGSFGFWAILLNTNVAFTWQKFSYLEARQQLIKANAGINGMLYPGKKSIYLVHLNTQLAEDNYSIANPILRYSGSALMIHKVSKVFSYTLGVAYAYVYGFGLPLPVIGVQFNMGKKSKINFIFPFQLSYRYRFGKENSFGVFFSPAGSLYNVSNRSKKVGYDDVFQFSQRVFRLGASVGISVTSGIKLLPEVGYNFKRNISLLEKGDKIKDAFFKEQVTPGPYFGLNLQIRFGSASRYSNDDAVNYLLDNGIDNLPLNGEGKQNSD